MRQDVGCSSSSDSEASKGAVAAERSEDMGERNSERPDERKEASVGQSRFLTKGIEGQKLSAYKWWCLYRLSDIRSITTLYPKPRSSATHPSLPVHTLNAKPYPFRESQRHQILIPHLTCFLGIYCFQSNMASNLIMASPTERFFYGRRSFRTFSWRTHITVFSDHF